MEVGDGTTADGEEFTHEDSCLVCVGRKGQGFREEKEVGSS